MSVLDRPRDVHGDQMTYEISDLGALESEAIHVIREVAAEPGRGVLLFSGGKDSAVLLRLARKAFHPGALPFPVMHVDTGHNFPEVIEYRDRMVAEVCAELIVASVQESIDKGRVTEETGPRASRNRLQSVTLLDAIEDKRGPWIADSVLTILRSMATWYASRNDDYQIPVGTDILL